MTRTWALCVIGMWVAGCGGGSPRPGQSPAAVASDQEADDDAPVHPYVVALRLEEGDESEDGTPHTQVSLVRIAPDGNRVVESIRNEAGPCVVEDAPPGALSVVTCWWAGAGARYELRREGDAVVAMRADTDEGAAPIEPEEAARVSVPADAELSVLTPGQAGSAPRPE